MAVLLNKKKENLIVISDMDEVLTYISPVWYSKIRENWSIFEPYFKNLGDLNKDSILDREEYYLNKWLKKENVEKIPSDILEKYLGLYMNGDFYKDCKPSKFGIGLGLLCLNNTIEKMYILSHTIPGTEESKRAFFEEYYKHTKTELVMLPPNISKHQWINDNKIDYDLFIDDRVDIIRDVILHTKSDFRDFYVPEFGYNKISECKGFKEAVVKKNCSISTYKVNIYDYDEE